MALILGPLMACCFAASQKLRKAKRVGAQEARERIKHVNCDQLAAVHLTKHKIYENIGKTVCGENQTK